MNGILIDVTKCTGCERCVEVCKASHDLKPEVPFRRLLKDNLSSRRYSTIVPQGSDRYVKKQCLHCLEPGCVEACLVGAITKTPEGPVIYDKSTCIGCRYCLLACPMGIPRYEWEEKLPYMIKCDMCFDRLKEGRIPACVEACPEKACVFGDYETLLAEARQTIASNKDRYLSHIYGEKELGGTSVLYISDVPLDRLNWPDKLQDKAMHDITWPVLSKTPFLAGGVATFLIGTHQIIRRRMKIQDEDHHPGEPTEADDSENK